MKSNPFKKKKYNNIYYKNSRKEKKRSLFKLPENNKNKKKYEKEIYLDSYKKTSKSFWVIPIASILLIILIVFWVGPITLDYVSKIFNYNEQTQEPTKLLYETGDFMVVKKQVADVFSSPDIKATRLTQALYNEVVEIVDDSSFGFQKVILDDGSQGYIMSEDLTSNTNGVEPSNFLHKIIISAQTKRIMTHAASGTLVMEALMGTTLYSDYAGSNIYRVLLPDGTNGWISASGIIRIDANEEVLTSTQKKFYETCISFNNTTLIPGGISSKGAWVDGIAYISAKINGVEIPRTMNLQINYGESVSLLYNEESNEILYEEFANGDLLFFGNKTSEGDFNVNDMGIVVGYGQVLMANKSTSSLRITRFENDSEIGENIIAARRIFDN